MPKFVRSRNGNVALAVLGAIYAVAGLATLVAYTIDVWDGAGILDRLLLVCLAAAAGGGVWFLILGLRNLGVSLHRYHIGH